MKGIPLKQLRAEQRRKRAQAASGLATGAKSPPKLGARLNIIETLADQNLLGRSLIGGAATWQSWLSFLRAFFGLPLSDIDATLYHECTARAALPDGPFRKGYLICGRGGGKTYMLSVMCVFLHVSAIGRRVLRLAAGRLCCLLLRRGSRARSR